jgi:flagellar hook-length control protein FliK
VAWSARQDLGEVEIQLHPPELGPLRLLLRMEGAELAVQFSAPHAATREALEQGLPRLRELLHAHGLALVQAQVSDQQQRARREPAFGNRPAEPVPEPVVEARALQLKRLGLLDEYA